VSLRKKSAEKIYWPVNLIVHSFINGMHAVKISNAWCISEILVIKSSWVSPTRGASMRSSKYHRFPHGHFIPSRPLPLSQRSWWLNRHESPLQGEPQWGVANIIDFLMDVSFFHVPSCYRVLSKTVETGKLLLYVSQRSWWNISSWVSPRRRASIRSSKYHRFPHGRSHTNICLKFRQ